MIEESPGGSEAECDAWIASRPIAVQALIEEFPPGMRFDLDGVIHWLMGYTESDMLILTPTDPQNVSFDQIAEENRVYLCAEHVRNLRNTHAH